jgi:hypothetical protein
LPDVFDAKIGDAVSARDLEGYKVAVLREVIPANPGADSEGVAAIRQQLTDTLRGDLQAQFAMALRDEYPVSVNQKALDELF